MTLFKERFKEEQPKHGLRFYGIPNPTLKEFKSNQNKNNFDFEPDEKYRLRDEEIQGEGDVSFAGYSTTEQTADNFTFENRSSISNKKGKDHPDIPHSSIDLGSGVEVDNLKDHLNELELTTESSFDDMQRMHNAQETKEKGQRRLTNQEKEELGSA